MYKWKPIKYKNFSEWAKDHQYLPIVERDFRAIWDFAWQAALDKVDSELEGIDASNALRDHISTNCQQYPIVGSDTTAT